MTEYTPLKKAPSGKGSTGAVRVKSADERFRNELIIDTCAEWVKADPQGALAFIEETKVMKENQRKKHGGLKGKNDANLYVKYRMPQTLLDCIRLALRWAEQTYDMEFEVFGMDDKDMKILVQTFPDLFKYCHNMTWAK